MNVDKFSCNHDSRVAVQRLVEFYEGLTGEHLQRLDAYYAADAFFKDPFNEVLGVTAIASIFEHMFASLQEPRFVVTQTLVQGDRAFLEWEFHFRLGLWRSEVEQCIRGASSVCFDCEGRVTHHHDYWDTAEELYEKLPLLGILMRWLRRAVSAPAKSVHTNDSAS